jgi:hypothetical protein
MKMTQPPPMDAVRLVSRGNIPAALAVAGLAAQNNGTAGRAINAGAV